MGQTCVIPQIEAPLIPRLRCRANGRGGLLKGAVAVGNLAITPAASERRPVARFAAVILALALVAGGGRVCYFVVGGTEYAIVTDFDKPDTSRHVAGPRIQISASSVRTIDR